jgi:hypothetical protein
MVPFMIQISRSPVAVLVQTMSGWLPPPKAPTPEMYH